MKTNEEHPRLAAGVRLKIDDVTGEAVLLYPEGILQLNETAQAIVQRCDGLTTMAQIANALAAEYEIHESELCRDVMECVEDLRRQKLIEYAS